MINASQITPEQIRIIRASGERTNYLQFISGQLHQMYIATDNSFAPQGAKQIFWLPVESYETTTPQQEGVTSNEG